MKSTLIALFIFISGSLFSQFKCTTVGTIPALNYTSLSRYLYADPSIEGFLCVNVYFHIVGNASTTAITEHEIFGIIDDLNSAYLPAKIRFNNLGHDVYRNSNYDETSNSEKSELLKVHNVPNAINIYIVISSGDFHGWSEDIPSRNIIITKEYVFTNTLAHEVGHCLNLYHTHETQFDKPGKTSCSETGDLLCDTPADPNLRDCICVTNCIYTGPLVDKPDPKNIMSYALPGCLEHFSKQQIIRMRDAILSNDKLKPILNIDCTDLLILGKSVMSNSESTTYILTIGTGTFTFSSNLKRMSSTPNSITVMAINSSVNDYAYVSITVNGINLKKDIWIGKPKVDLIMASNVNYVDLTLVGLNSDIHRQQIKHIEWNKLSVTGSAIMGIAVDQFQNLAHGSGTNWGINARIILVNDAGTTYLDRFITPSAPQPCENSIRINKSNVNEYAVVQIIDPCSNSVSLKSTDILQEDQMENAKLFDVLGNVIRTYNENRFDVSGVKKGVYILYVKMKNNTITQKIFIE